MLRWIVAGFLLLGFLSGCVKPGGPQVGDLLADTPEEGAAWAERNYGRIVDEEAGVACWFNLKGGIDCLPLGQTLLGKE